MVYGLTQKVPQIAHHENRTSKDYLYYIMDTRRFPGIIGKGRRAQIDEIKIEDEYYLAVIILIIYFLLVVLAVFIAIIDELSIKKQNILKDG